MSPTTARVVPLRLAGSLLVAAALVAGPATTALAEPTAEPTPSASASVTGTPSPSPTTSLEPTPSPSATASPAPTESAAPSESAAPTAPSSPTPEATRSGGTATADPAAGLVEGRRTTSFGPDATTGPVTSTDPALVGARYLQQQLGAGDHHFSVTFDGVDYPDHGVTADAVLALDAAGTGQDEAAKATAWLTGEVVNYLGFGDPTEISAGSAAKLLNVALAQGVDPTAFGGYDLLATVRGLEQPSGRFADKTKYTDYSNTFGQAFALLGLDRAGDTVSADARDYLLVQQCPNGGFKLYMNDAGCTTDADADPDATAMAVQALLAVGGASTDAGEGLDYLASRQASSGGVGGGGPTAGTNANSTGLAGQAFLAGGRTAQARAAAEYLTDLQYDCTFPPALRGGIAYDAAAFTATRETGDKATPQDQDRRSTSQALLALAGTPLSAVTAAGADAVAPALECTAPTTTPSPTGTATPGTTVEPTEGAGSGDSGGSDASGASGGSDGSTGSGGAVVAGPTGSLAQTGSDLLLPVGLGLALVLVGGLAVVASRRRGAHA